MQTTFKYQFIIIAAAVACLAGCRHQQKPKYSVNDYFRPDDEPRAMNNMFNAQVAQAAREDGMLYAHHFTGGKLNSLGEQKLLAMTGGTERGKIEVYLVMPKDADFSDRQNDVIAFLQSRGLKDDAFAVSEGFNPKSSAPAAQGLAGLSKQQSLPSDNVAGASAAAGAGIAIK